MKNIAFLPFLLCITLLAACVETDISVPGFPDMVRYFSTTEGHIQLTMSINFLGFCLAGLFLGPLSDAYGRRPVMLWGNVIFLIGAIGTATAPTLTTLIAWRFFQGIGASAAFTLFIAMIADAYQGERASHLASRLNAMLTAAMAGAPMLGGLLVETWGWRSTYSSVAVLCLVATILLFLFLPETNQNRQPLELKKILRNYKLLITSRDFIALALVPTVLCAGYMAFVSCAVFFYTEQLKVPLGLFTLHQGCVIACFSVVSFFGGKIYALVGARQAVVAGAIVNMVGASGLVLLSLLDSSSAMLFTLSMSMFSTGVALSYGPTFTASMEVMSEIKGTASSLNSSIRLIVMALLIGLAGYTYDGTFLPVATIQFACASSAALLTVFIVGRPHLRELLA